jgi:hypothetical protein
MLLSMPDINVNQLSSCSSMTALMFACYKGNKEIVLLLLSDINIDVNITRNNRKTLMLEKDHDEYG